jgi:hypothetical protein
MPGWKKFLSGEDEDLEERAGQIQSLFDAIESVGDRDQLKSIMHQLEALGVSTSDIPAFASGGKFYTSGPQMVMVGDNPGGIERVEITPISSPAAEHDGGAGTVINIYGPVFDYEDLYRNITRAGAKVNRKKII